MMANLNPKTENLVKQKSRWKHLPTQVLRVPEIFIPELLAKTEALDNGIEQTNESTSLIKQLQICSIEELLKIQREIESILKQKREEQCDRRLEQAITLLAEPSDETNSGDRTGFSPIDACFRQWLAQRICHHQPLVQYLARAALTMIQTYKEQLSNSGLELPAWEAIAHQYPETLTKADEDAIAEKRLELLGSQIGLFSPYDPAELLRIKSIEPKRRFNGSDKGWYFPVEAASVLLSTFSDYEVDPNLEGVIALQEGEAAVDNVQRQREALEQASELIRYVQAAQLDQSLSNGWNLYEHQKQGVEWLLTRRRGGLYRGAILADHMGLGKTLEALVAAKAMQRTHDCYVFIICPASLRENWAIEAANVGVQIETFSWAKLPKPLEHSQYVLIADEAHYAQNLTSQRTQNHLALAESENCLASWLLTGTPIKNGRPVNLFPLLLACNHPLAENRWDYERHFCAAKHQSFGRRTFWDTTGAAHLDELSQKTEDVILRRTKKDCLDLPPKIRTLKPVEISPETHKAYEARLKALVKAYKARVKAKLISDQAEALVTLGQLRLAGSEAKVEAAIEMAQAILEQDQPVVLFTEYKESALSLHQALGGELLTGETPTDSRQAIVNRFQSGTSHVFTGTIKAGGVGLTLTASSHVILVDRPWTPGDAEQAEDRCYRIGQAETVNSFWLQLGTVDTAIDSLLEAKGQRIELIMKGKRKTLRGINSPTELAIELLNQL